MSAGYVLVRLKRPEGYEDVHPELVLQDASINPAFEPELVDVREEIRIERDPETGHTRIAVPDGVDLPDGGQQ